MRRGTNPLDRKLGPIVGGRTADSLAQHLDVHTVDQLLRYYPRRYERRGQMTDLSKLPLEEHVTVMARVEHSVLRDYRDKRSGGRLKKRLELTVTDGRGELLLTFFGRGAFVGNTLRPGTVGLFAGKVGQFRNRRQLLHPDFVLLSPEEAGQLGGDPAPEGVDVIEGFVGSVLPIYPATQAVSTWTISRAVELVLDQVDELEDDDDPIPAVVRAEHGFVGLAEAYRGIHRPASEEQLETARQRLRFEEALVVQTVLARKRAAAQELPATPRPPRDDGLLAAFDERLPFELTDGQRVVGRTLAAELGRSHPMHRLLQGEVGSGKTVVALRAMLQTVDGGGQAVLLAPTEVLAAQHHRSISAMLGPLARAGMLDSATQATRVRLLTGSMGARARREALLDAASGEAGIVVGTHALLEDRVQFADLGLVVVDEQHRFGVEQRAQLNAKAGDQRPHVLVMTATPIPRTVAMTVFGDLETSTLSELPAGRQPIQTNVVPTSRPAWVERCWERVREEVAQGRQAYVVCARIGDQADPTAALDVREVGDPADAADTGDDDGHGTGEAPQPRAAVDVHEELSTGPLSGLRVELLHGRMTPEAKDEVMSRFAAGAVDVLVATTVIEVGVDVPNASTMVVMDAERFGLSQLHQLRGRVGRGGLPGLCLLVTQTSERSRSHERLAAVASTTDGFELAQLDLRTRREGDVLGVSQSGRRSGLQLLSVIDHEDVIADARTTAETIVRSDPLLLDNLPLAASVHRFGQTRGADYLEKS
jgi:ATP-dependent DNA helicase RecG